jgi:DNA-binding PadR family transcriptional regulator
MEDIKVTNLVKFQILFLLYQRPIHGYELMAEIEKVLGTKPSASQIYPFLSTLKDNNIISIKQEAERDKKIYELTGNGREFVKKKLEMFGGIFTATIEKDLSTCAHCGCKVYSGGHEEVVDSEKLTFCCMHCAGTYKRGNH